VSLPLLTVEDVSCRFPVRRGVFGRVRGTIHAVESVSFTLERGETLGIVGESGCGKSTLARTLLRLEQASAGRATLEGQSLLDASGSALRNLRRRMQMVFQDPAAALNPRMTTQDILTEGLVANGMLGTRSRAEAASELLDQVGLNHEALYRYPHEFSGGQRQRINIARAIALEPAVVICDEAVSALDVSVQAQVLNLLSDLKARLGLSYLFISHDLGIVRHVAQRVVVMYLGRIVEMGPAEAVIDNPRHPYTQALVSAIPKVGQRGDRRIVLGGEVPSPLHPPEGCAFHPRCPFATDACRAGIPGLEPCRDDPHPSRRVACIRRDALAAGEAEASTDAD